MFQVERLEFGGASGMFHVEHWTKKLQKLPGFPLFGLFTGTGRGETSTQLKSMRPKELEGPPIPGEKKLSTGFRNSPQGTALCLPR